jgi:hypothetical protein
MLLSMMMVAVLHYFLLGVCSACRGRHGRRRSSKKDFGSSSDMDLVFGAIMVHQKPRWAWVASVPLLTF